MAIESLLSTSIPDKSNSIELRGLAAEKQKKDLVDLILKCQNKLHLEIDSVMKFFSNIDTKKKLSPAFYLYSQNLREAINSSSLTTILDAIQSIHWLQSYGVYEPDLRISSILSEYWEQQYIQVMRNYRQKNLCGESTIVRPIFNIDSHKRNIEEALKLIELGDVDISNEIKELVTSIKLFQGRVLRGQASGDTFGAMWLKIPDPNDDQVGYWIEHIVHEVSHIKLHAMFFQEKLVLNPDNELKFRAPIRDDLRPMLGVFHATFVLARMVRVFKNLSFKGYVARFRDRLQLCELQFEIGLNSVHSKEAKLSDNGKKIRDSFKTCALIKES